MPNHFKVRQLEGFVAAAETGSFTQAAARLAMTPPAFTQLIRELEGTAGVVLFERTTRRVALTEAGQQLLMSVRRPLEDLSQAYGDMMDLAGGRKGRVAFSVLHSLAFGIGTATLGKFRVSHADISVQMIEDQNDILIERVLNRDVDFGLGMYTEKNDLLDFEPLMEDELVLVLPNDHALLDQDVVPWDTLARYPLILLPAKSSVRRLVDAGLVVQNAPRAAVQEIVSMVTAVNLVAGGLGLTVLPELSLTSLKTDGITFRRIGPPAPRRKIGIIRRANRPISRSDEAFTAQLREVIREFTGSGTTVSPRI